MAYIKRGMGDPFWGSGTSGGTQPVPSSQPQAPSSYGTPATTPPPDPTKKDSGPLSEIAKLFGALALSKVGTPSPTNPYVVPQPARGISPTTMLIGGAIGVTALVLLLK